jgi:hypothetical protein
MDVAGIVSELRSVQKGLGEGIPLLERSQPLPGTSRGSGSLLRNAHGSTPSEGWVSKGWRR